MAAIHHLKALITAMKAMNLSSGFLFAILSFPRLRAGAETGVPAALRTGARNIVSVFMRLQEDLS